MKCFLMKGRGELTIRQVQLSKILTGLRNKICLKTTVQQTVSILTGVRVRAWEDSSQSFRICSARLLVGSLRNQEKRLIKLPKKTYL